MGLQHATPSTHLEGGGHPEDLGDYHEQYGNGNEEEQAKDYGEGLAVVDPEIGSPSDNLFVMMLLTNLF